MKRREMGELLSKILGVVLLYWFIRVCLNPGTYRHAQIMYNYFFGPNPGPYFYYPSLTALLSVMLVPVTAFIFLFFSKRIGRLIYRENPDDPLFEQIDAVGAQTMVFSSVALFFVIIGVSEFVQHLSALFMDPQNPKLIRQTWSGSTGPAMKAILGLFLLFYARRVSQRLLGTRRPD